MSWRGNGNPAVSPPWNSHPEIDFQIVRNESPTIPACDCLVIGYGNTLRGDDGVGLRTVEAVADLQLPGVQTLVCPQLSPEHAELVAQARTVIFVDAAVHAPGEVRLQPLSPADASQLVAHAADPETVLALARDVFGRVPEAWLLTIPIETLDFCEALSSTAQRGLEQAVREIQELLPDRN